uniref:ATP synthase subunit a n1 TaxMyrothecium leucotrichum RepIDQ5VGX4_9HYPO n=1 Tax=Fusarium pseudograminearum CS3427 TaxID=1318457 RepID=W1IAT7_FUSPS
MLNSICPAVIFAANLRPNETFLARYDRMYSWPIYILIFNHIFLTYGYRCECASYINAKQTNARNIGFALHY